jgi:hypothetical protein
MSSSPGGKPQAPTPTLMQTMMLHGVIPVLLVGLLLPLGLVGLFLAADNGEAGAAIKHGELFLAAGNAAFTGCVVLVSSRLDQLLNAVIASLVVLVLIVVPAYGCWSFLTAQQLLQKPGSENLAIVGGGCFALVAIAVALVFVRLSYTPTQRARRQVK